jgi:hypothetical protein
VLLDWDKGVCIHRAHVGDGEGGMATGTGTETRKAFEDFVEKSETRAIGRALAALGVGTQFVGEELSEGEHVADAPVTTIPRQNIISNDVVPLPTGEEPTHSPPEQHPSADEITKLVETARAANVDLEAFGRDMRRLMTLPDGQKITKKFLREHMTMAQYNTARHGYGEKLRVILEEDVPTHEPPTQAVDADASTNVPASTTEGTPAPFVESSSASVPDADATAREKLRQEALSWYIQPVEIEHILAHHPLEKARNLLWKARRNMPPPTWVPVTAD